MLALKNWQMRSYIVYIGHNPHAWNGWEMFLLGPINVCVFNMNINQSCLQVFYAYISNLFVVLFVVEISHWKVVQSLCFQQWQMEWRHFWT